MQAAPSLSLCTPGSNLPLCWALGWVLGNRKMRMSAAQRLGGWELEVNRFCLMLQLNRQLSLPGSCWKTSHSCVSGFTPHPGAELPFLWPDTIFDSCVSSPQTVKPQGKDPSDGCLLPGKLRAGQRGWNGVAGAGKPLEACNVSCSAWSWGDSGRNSHCPQSIGLQVQPADPPKEGVPHRPEDTSTGSCKEVSCPERDEEPRPERWTGFLHGAMCSHTTRLCPKNLLPMTMTWEQVPPCPSTPLSCSYLPPGCVHRASGKEGMGTAEGLWAATVCADRAVLPWAEAGAARTPRPPAGAQRHCPGLLWGSVQKHSWCRHFWMADCPDCCWHPLSTLPSQGGWPRPSGGGWWWGQISHLGLQSWWTVEDTLGVGTKWVMEIRYNWFDQGWEQNYL